MRKRNESLRFGSHYGVMCRVRGHLVRVKESQSYESPRRAEIRLSSTQEPPRVPRQRFVSNPKHKMSGSVSVQSVVHSVCVTECVWMFRNMESDTGCRNGNFKEAHLNTNANHIFVLINILILTKYMTVNREKCNAQYVRSRNMVFNCDICQQFSPIQVDGTCYNVNNCPEAFQTWPPTGRTSINLLWFYS